jgi:uncharacterized coiled-coil DUF342 family protein
MTLMARETWTDERLDDLNKKVDDGFARVGDDIRELRGELKTQGKELRAEIKAQGEELRGEIKSQGKELRGEMNELRREMNERFDSVNRTLVGAVAVIIAAIIGSNLLG